MVYWKKNPNYKKVESPVYKVECNKTYEEFYNDIFQEVKKLRGKIWSDDVIKQEMTNWTSIIQKYYKFLTITKESNVDSNLFYIRELESVGRLVADMAV